MLQDYIKSLRDELQDIERRQKELKILRSQKISQLDQALYRQALEGMPFPPGTKVTVTYRNHNGTQERAICFLGEPKPTGDRLKPYLLSFLQESDGRKTNLRETRFHPLQVLDIKKSQ